MNSRNETEPISTSPIVDEVRAIRRKLAERFDFDVEKLCEYLREQEQQHPERLVQPPETVTRRP